MKGRQEDISRQVCSDGLGKPYLKRWGIDLGTRPRGRGGGAFKGPPEQGRTLVQFEPYPGVIAIVLWEDNLL